VTTPVGIGPVLARRSDDQWDVPGTGDGGVVIPSPAGSGAIDESSLMSISNFKGPAFRALFPRYYNASQEGFVVISNCLQPTSRGSVGLLNRHMRRNPLIDPNYLSSEEDVACTIAAIRSAVEVSHTL